ncbi:MAG: nitroreductase family protein [Pseudomonadota bacterium]
MTRNRDGTWALTDADFPYGQAFSSQADMLLRYAILAPSGHNTQPWMFEVGDGWIDMFADRRRALPVVDPYDRELVISCGAALGTLEIAAAHFGFEPTVTLNPDGGDADRLARVDLGTGAGVRQGSDGSFGAITQRRTTRASYGPERPPQEVIDLCVSDAEIHGIGFGAVSDAGKRRAIAELVAEGDRIQFDDPAFRRELAAWVHSTRLGSRDGMSGSGFGMPDLLAPVARFVIRTFDLGDGVAAGDETKIVDGTPMLALLSSARDDQECWIQCGRALARVLLTLTAAGFTSSYLNQPIETASLRHPLKEVSGVDGFPQLLLRIGRARERPPPTVRRDVKDVLVRTGSD